MRRREFIAGIAIGSCAVASGCAHYPARAPSSSNRLFFTSRGKTCLIHSDGSGFRVLEFNQPDQVTWQPGPFFSDGRRVMFLSMEARRDGPGRPFDEYYTQTPTHLWIYDLESNSLTEIATKERKAVFYTPELLLNDDRMLVQVVRNKVGQVYSMNLDGTDAREFTRAGEGLPYGSTLSPDRRRVAFHLASPVVTRSGPATLTAPTAPLWRGSLTTSTLVRAGRRLASGWLFKIATSRTIPDTRARTCASRGLTVPRCEC